MLKSYFNRISEIQKNRFYILILVISISILSLFALSSLYKAFERTRKENRKEYLQQNLQKAVLEFKKGVEKYAILVSGLRSHIIETGKVPTEQEAQNFLINQLQVSKFGHSVIINYLDDKHNFVFSISEKNLTPNKLVGVNVHRLRDSKAIKRLEHLLSTDEVIIFPIINLIEGFVGLPINFRVNIDNEVVGYVAPLIDIKNILDLVTQSDQKQEFTYRFSYGDDVEFDREQVFDNNKVYNTKIDSTNLHLPKAQYLTQTFTFFEMPFTIGIAYNNNSNTGSFNAFIQGSFFIILSFIIFSAFLIYLFLQYLLKSRHLNRSNQEISYMNTILKRFIYASSHDLKQPLVNINNFHSLIKKKYGNQFDSTGKKYLEVISNNVIYMDAMLDDLLVYSKIIDEQKEKEVFDLNTLIEQVKNAYSLERVEIRSEDLPQIKGVKSEIGRLFHNLISNAIKFNTNPTAQVDISAQDLGEEVEITVSDNGIGIKEEHLDLVFKEFQRLHKNKYQGTGLGLAICKEIVNNHGGAIKARRNTSEGTSFIFKLSTNG